MTIEQLQAMSDTDLNELAAVKVMQYDKEGIDIKLMMARGEWNPAGDMNHAYELLKALIPTWTVSIGYNLSGWEIGLWTGVKDGDNFVSASDHLFPKAITIAAILAREGTL